MVTKLLPLDSMDTTANILYKYQNGNTTVTILYDGTKIREYENSPQVVHPESIDVKITNHCNKGCFFCFLPDSLVLTPDGRRPIKDILTLDEVYSYNFTTKSIERSKVERAIVNKINEEIIIIELEDGSNIKCTKDHKIYTTNRGWVKAEEISSMDDVFNAF